MLFKLKTNRKLILGVAVGGLFLGGCGGTEDFITDILELPGTEDEPTVVQPETLQPEPVTVTTTLQGLDDCTVVDSTAATLCGEILAADNITPIAGAELTLSNQNGNPSTPCTTDQIGEYACLATGAADGSTLNIDVAAPGFETTTLAVTASTGAVNSVSDVSLQGTVGTGGATTGSAVSGNWLVQKGSYDSVEQLLAELKGCDVNDCQSSGLTVVDDVRNEILGDFETVFVNCGSYISGDANQLSAYATHVGNGGNIYFSDLEADDVETLYNQAVTVSNASTSTGEVQGTTVDANLSALVGPSVELLFDLPVWKALESVGDDVKVFVEADTSSLNGPSGDIPITIGFRPTPSSGCVFFTSYHLESAPSGSDQEAVLKYLVQNINTVCD